MRAGDFRWDESPISIVRDDEGVMYVVDGHHRLAAAKYARVNVHVNDVTDTLQREGFLGYKDMDDVLQSAAQFTGNRLNRYKLR